MLCHMCNSETEYTCQTCDEPVCENCTVQMTYHNQIDYTKCQCCQDGHDAQRRLEWLKEDQIRQIEKTKKDKINSKARANYWKPENVEKRKLKSIQRKKDKIERNKKILEEAMRIVGEMFI